MKDAFEPGRRRVTAAYSTAQVASFLRLPRATVRAWSRGQSYRSGGRARFFRPVIQPATTTGVLAFSFVNLIELHVLGALRREHGLSLQSIRHSLDFLCKRYQVEHPLADMDLLTDGLDLWLKELGVLIATSRDGQIGIREVVEAHLQRVTRDEHGHALNLYPFTRDALLEAPRSIVIDPTIAFGQPVLVGTNIPTRIIEGRFSAGDSFEVLAGDYDRTTDEIQEAIRWERRRAA